MIVIDTLSPTHNAEQRAVQLIAPLNQVIAFSATVGHPLLGRVDGNRLGVMGHSYGGGGALLAGTNNPSLKAVIPLAPYYESTSFPRLTVPTLVMGCQRDVVAPVAVRAIPMYESIRGPARGRPSGGRNFGVPGELPVLMRPFHPAAQAPGA